MYSQQAELLPVNSVKFPLRLEDKSDVMVTRHVIQDLCLIPDKGKGGCLRYCAAGISLYFHPVTYPVFVLRAVSADNKNLHPAVVTNAWS